MPDERQLIRNGQTLVHTVITTTPSTTIPVPAGTVSSASVSNTTASQIMANIINNTQNTSGPSILKTKAGHTSELITAGSEDSLYPFTARGYSAVDNYDSIEPPAKRKKRDPKTGKGLRHFSMKVCEKVKIKGTTTYNEVADELVAEFSADPIANRAAFQGGYMPGDQEPFDQKNIRRRVYDALNVLMAMNIISKEKKEIKWIGLPTNAAQECAELEQEKQKRLERIAAKKQQLRDLLLHQIAFKNLVERNKSLSITPQTNAIINLPFIVVNTEKKTVIDCSISNDKTEYLFNFDNTFEIHDDIEVLKRMGLAYGLERTLMNSQASNIANGAGNGTSTGNHLGSNGGSTVPLFTLDKHNYDKARSLLPEALRCELDEMIDEYNTKHSSGSVCTSQTSPSKLRH